MNIQQDNTIAIRPYTFSELCIMYQTSSKTFRKWLEPIRDDLADNGRKKLYTIAEVQTIFSILGAPVSVID